MLILDVCNLHLFCGQTHRPEAKIPIDCSHSSLVAIGKDRPSEDLGESGNDAIQTRDLLSKKNRPMALVLIR